MAEGFGLYVADEKGNTLLDTSVRSMKILGSFVIPAGRTEFVFRAVIPSLPNNKVFYYAQGNAFDAANAVVSFTLALFTFKTLLEGDKLTITAEYSRAVMGSKKIRSVNSVDIRVFYGVY